MPNVLVLGGRAYGTLYCCCCSVVHSCLTLCNSMDCSMPGFPVLHHLLEFTLTHVHWVGDAIQPSHPLSSPSPPCLGFAQLLGSVGSFIKFEKFSIFPTPGSFPVSQLFTSGSQSIGDSASAPVLLMNIQDWFPLGWTGWISLQAKGLSRVFPTPHFKSITSEKALSLLYCSTLTSTHD